MKLYEVLTEMAWPDKFHQLEQRIRSSNMTMGELFDLLFKEYGIRVLPQADLNSDPLTVGSAAITPRKLTANDVAPDASEEIKQRLIGNRALQIELGPGVSETTPAKEVGGLLQVLRHELGHYQQGIGMSPEKSDAMQRAYVSADGDQMPTAQQNIMYALQPIERPQQVLDMAHYIAQLGGTIDGFFSAVHQTAKKILETPDDIDASIDEVALFHAGHEMEAGMGIDSEEKASKLYQEGGHTAMRMVHATIAQLAMAHLAVLFTEDKQYGKKLKAQLFQYEKLLKKRFPKVKGYYSRTKDDDVKSFVKNNPTRGEIQQQMQLMAQMADALGIMRGE